MGSIPVRVTKKDTTLLGGDFFGDPRESNNIAHTVKKTQLKLDFFDGMSAGSFRCLHCSFAYSPYPMGLFFCQFQESRHISSRVFSAVQPSFSLLLAGSA